MRPFLYILLQLHLVCAKNEMYDGSALFEITVYESAHVKLVDDLCHRYNGDVWSIALPGRPGRVLIHQTDKEQFENELRQYGIQVLRNTDNIKDLIDMEAEHLAMRPRELYNTSREAVPLNNIYTYEEINEYMETIAAAYPNTVKVFTGGKSFEGRSIKYLKISTTNFEHESKPVIFIQSLIHSREWITQSVALYAIRKLVIDVTDPEMVEEIDWIILPIANPDGFVHTYDQARFWRKNRATGYSPNNICVGVDLNRNFDYKWSAASSGAACSDTFHGARPFSEPEALIIRDIFDENSQRMKLFLDIHSYGSMILYGFGNGVLPPNGLWLHLVGINMAESIDAAKESWNPNYTVGNVALVVYKASGNAMDYAQSIGVTYSYTFELPGRRNGIGALGFLVDPDFIEQAGYETWEGIKVGAKYVKDNHSRGTLVKNEI